MTSIAWAVTRFKDNPLEHLDHRLVLEACAAAGHVWRRRLLDPIVTVRLMLLQVLFANVSCRRLSRIAGMRFSVSV